MARKKKEEKSEAQLKLDAQAAFRERLNSGEFGEIKTVAGEGGESFQALPFSILLIDGERVIKRSA